MVNNSTNIHKTNKYLLLYLLIVHKKNMTYDAGNLGPVLGEAQKCGDNGW